MQDSGVRNEKLSFQNGINDDARNSGQSRKELNLELINGMIGKLALSQQKQQINLNNALSGAAKSNSRNSAALSDR